ncbi:MAG TPA: cytochrome C [Frateuria sp.]|uniref:cytochrome C n=1 Tax=Frateuria sp. TaxID=2211372 RepID=UPI002D80A347|nr:cytochrome C [Frateuria sp.]HET6806945.1 cytochrome C [Frateuria sp.]
MSVAFARLVACAVSIAVVLMLAARPAYAVPSFAAQTGEPCSTCHVGAFGPQLTPFGRAFKIGGYTETGGQGPAAHIPLAAMVLGSFTHTEGSQPSPAAPHFADNNNPALDQISAFLAGRVTDFAGAFVQGTYSGIDQSITLDNTDVRITHPFHVGVTDLQLGASLNSAPTVQDPYNSMPAWIFPFAASALAPTPALEPLLFGGLASNSIGLTLYGWYDRSLYAEAGVYVTRSPYLLGLTGATLGPGATAGPAPYVRLAYEWDWNDQAVHVGGVLLAANLNPAAGPRRSDSSAGQDHYLDIGVDAGYQFLGSGRHVVSTDLLLLHENRRLNGSAALGSVASPNGRLNEIRASATYFFQATYGLTLGWQNIWGTADPVLLAPAPVSGSRTGSPNSNAFIIEADWVPFGKETSWARPFANLKIGVQDTIYTRFNGSGANYDGFGRRAGANNTLFAYAWLAF